MENNRNANVCFYRELILSWQIFLTLHNAFLKTEGTFFQTLREKQKSIKSNRL
jgi:hypothetical protein